MTDDQPPTFKPVGRVLATTPDESRVAGHYGPSSERQGLCYASRRDSHAHRLRALDAYAISTEVLGTLKRMGVERVFIVETDTGDVYEYTVDDFTEWGDPVPEEFLEHGADPQRYHARDDPLNHWPNHAASFYADAEDVDPEDVGFTSASEVHDDA